MASLKPTGVLLAVGAKPVVPPIPASPCLNVHLAEDVFRCETVLTGRVAVVGTGMTGLEMAETLLEKGCAVTLIDMLPKPGNGIYKVILDDVLSRITPFNPPMLTGHRLTGVQEKSVTVVDVSTNRKKTIPADHVVLALGVAPDKTLLSQYAAVCPRVLTVGDASQSGRITEAVREGFARAYVL